MVLIHSVTIALTCCRYQYNYKCNQFSQSASWSFLWTRYANETQIGYWNNEMVWQSGMITLCPQSLWQKLQKRICLIANCYIYFSLSVAVRVCSLNMVPEKNFSFVKLKPNPGLCIPETQVRFCLSQVSRKSDNKWQKQDTVEEKKWWSALLWSGEREQGER